MVTISTNDGGSQQRTQADSFYSALYDIKLNCEAVFQKLWIQKCFFPLSSILSILFLNQSIEMNHTSFHLPNDNFLSKNIDKIVIFFFMRQRMTRTTIPSQTRHNPLRIM